MLSIDLKGKVAFVAGLGDDQGYGWAIAKALAEAGASILIGTWVPLVKIFTTTWKAGKFDKSRQLADKSLMEYAQIYPIDASFDTPEDVPQDIRENKRYQEYSGYTVSEVTASIVRDFGKIDVLIHSLANGPEVKKPLLETSREGYLSALNASSYSLVSLVRHLGPHFREKGSVVSLSYIASERVIPGYGGGMSSAKAALESDTKTLAWEAGRQYGIRVNAISAGPYRSRAARAIGFIDNMIAYSAANAPLRKDLLSQEVGNVAAFLASSLASAITGITLYVDNGLHVMGLGVDSPSLHEPQKASTSLSS
jgi:enoyl-[acyl-carrier protein] reductase I